MNKVHADGDETKNNNNKNKQTTNKQTNKKQNKNPTTTEKQKKQFLLNLSLVTTLIKQYRNISFLE